MKTKLSKTEAKAKIDSFFKQPDLDKEQLRKIRRLAMKFNIKLKEHKKTFCKACQSQLKGKIRIKNGYKIVECRSCGYKNKFKI